ncbi:unnamed protein product [Tilletia caries]|nr:unnamed protein product [Tilletia caries]
MSKAARARQPGGRSALKAAMDAQTPEEAIKHLEAAKQTWRESEDIVDTFATAWRLRFSFLQEYGWYCARYYPGVDPWEDDENLLDRMSSYLQFRLENVPGSKGEGTKVKARTLDFWRGMLLSGLVEMIPEARRVAELLRGVRADHKDGYAYRLRIFTVALARKYDLVLHGDDCKFYGRPELTLLLFALERRLNRTPFAAQSSLQLYTLLLFSFYTGVRPSSLVQTEKTSGYAKVEDIVVFKRSLFEFTVQFNVKNLKGFSGALTRGIKQTWLLHSVTKLIMRGVLFDGDSGERVSDLDAFLHSRTNKFTCVGDAPLFLGGSQGLSKLGDKPLSGSAMARQIHSLCGEAGLPSVGSYAFRHNQGNRMSVMLGAEAAKMALSHDLEKDVTRRHYTHDTANVNWTALALEEDLSDEMKDRIRRPNTFFCSGLVLRHDRSWMPCATSTTRTA